MVSAVEAARNAAQKAIESTYEGICTVIERRNIRDESTKITRKSEVTVIENQPCKLSFEKLNAVGQTDTAAAISQGVKLFISPGVVISPGSKIVVEQNGKMTEYAASGVPAVYATHQEIILELFKEWC